MAKGSQSQASISASGIPRAPSSGSAPPKGTGGAGLRRRRTASTGSGSGASRSGNNSGNSGALRFYTDDTPGLKISPTVVLLMSFALIGFVTLLHAIGKFYGYRSRA